MTIAKKIAEHFTLLTKMPNNLLLFMFISFSNRGGGINCKNCTRNLQGAAGLLKGLNFNKL